MKNFKPSASIFLVPARLTFTATILLFMSHCIPVQSDANLIAQTCKQTPYVSLCVSAVRSDPRSNTADVQGLALIMVNMVKAKATKTLNVINHQLQTSKGPKQSLSACVSYYDAILTAGIPEAMEALQKGDPKFAEDATTDAANAASSCEASFHGKSPMTNLNKVVHDFSVIASAILRQLLQWISCLS